MRPLLFLLMLLGWFSCKTTKQAALPEKPADATKSIGVVSHEQKKTGCVSVIVVEPTADNPEKMVLIPSELPAEFDKNGQRIAFRYLPSRRPSPEGCFGIPAQVTEIEKLR
jgi:hypothetical protein